MKNDYNGSSFVLDNDAKKEDDSFVLPSSFGQKIIAYGFMLSAISSNCCIGIGFTVRRCNS